MEQECGICNMAAKRGRSTGMDVDGAEEAATEEYVVPVRFDPSMDVAAAARVQVLRGGAAAARRVEMLRLWLTAASYGGFPLWHARCDGGVSMAVDDEDDGGDGC